MAVARSLPDRVTKSQGEETIFGVVRTILRCSHRCRVCYRRDHSVPIMLCSRRDHSVCQTSANRNLENSDCRQCNLLAGNGVMGVHSAGEVSYLRLHCVDWYLLVNAVDNSVISVYSFGNDIQHCHFVTVDSVQHICHRGTAWIQPTGVIYMPLIILCIWLNNGFEIA